MTTRVIKCVVWDLDLTLLDGVLLEMEPGGISLDSGMREILAELDRRGILNSVASRNPPELGEQVLTSLDWPSPIIAPQLGWGSKSRSITEIADELDVAMDTIAFVDDDPFERAEVGAAHPEVVVLSPSEVRGALGRPEFTPSVMTKEGGTRAQRYMVAKWRTEASREFEGSRLEFLKSVNTTVTLRDAVVTDIPRLTELSVRTTRFNSIGMSLPADRFRELLAASDRGIVCIELADVFGDDGMIGAAVIAQDSVCWTVELVMISCRAMGRGVSDTVLRWILEAARSAGCHEVRVPLRVDQRNVPLRLALVGAGFRSETGLDSPVFVRSTDAPSTQSPEWVTTVWRR